LQIKVQNGSDYRIETSINLFNWTPVYTANSPATPFTWMYDSGECSSALLSCEDRAASETVTVALPMKSILIPAIAAIACVPTAFGQDTTEQTSADRARANFARVITLGPDDVRLFPDAPAGFDQPKPNIPRGKVEVFGYDSTVTGKRREANVYLPPDYSAEKKYPVLYLLHGLGGNQYEWSGYIKAPVVLDNLIAEGRAVPIIVVMPNGRALPDDRPPKEIYSPEHAASFARFEQDLLDCLIPAIQAKYGVHADREHRALAGLSMGGGQALNFGLGHPEIFAWVGGFSAAPNTRTPAEIIPDIPRARATLKLLYLSAGNKDGLINISQAVHLYLKAHDIPHVWNVDDHGHDGATWGNNFHHFVQRLFR